MKRAALALVCACGAAGKGGKSRECLPVAPMTLSVLEHGREWEPIAELRPDGTIVREGKPLARIANNELRTADDRPMLRCEGRTLFVEGRAMARFDAHDRFIDSDGSELFLDGKGVVHWTRQGTDILGASRLRGEWSRARRSALVLVIAVLAGGRAF